MSAPVPALKVGQYHVIAPPLPGGGALQIRRQNARNYVLRVDGCSRVRWATTLAEVRSDVAHFQATGTLPERAGTSWA